MTRNYKRLTLTVLIFFIVIGLYWHYSRPEPIEIIVQNVERGDVEATVANTRAGTVKACRRAGLSPAIGGQIAHLPIKEGDQVKAGELLLALWNDDLQAHLELAEQEAKSARARKQAICLQADVAQREANRLVKLKSSGAASEEQIDLAVTKAKAADADCAAAHANIDVASARGSVAAANLARTLLIAPFDGVIAEINGELNEYVTPSPPGIATLPAIDIIANDCFYISAPIDEVDAAAVKQGMPARISLDAFGKQRFDGHVRRIADYVLDREKQARTVDIEVEFNEPLQQLLAGYSADTEIILSAHSNVLRIPTLAVMEGPKVLVYDTDNEQLALRKIETGLSNWDYTEVISGLMESEQVVTSLDRAGVEEGAYAVIEDNDQ